MSEATAEEKLAELTDKFYVVREQRNKLLWACRKALDAYDAAHATGKSTWGGKDVDEMRMAVAHASAIYQPPKVLIPRCEHGIEDGEYCENCNREYKRAVQENESDSSTTKTT